MKEAELIEAIRSNQSLRIGGGATRGGGDFGFHEAGIIHYSPDELLITVKSGTSMKEMEAALDAHDQMLAAEVMDHRLILGTRGEPTIGGAICLNADGPRRLRYGSLKEALLGLRFVDGRGEILRAGGVVMKNVTGLDMTKLFAGSRGQLGVALEASFKLLPKPKERRSWSYEASLEEFETVFLPLLRSPLEITAMLWSAGQVYLRQEGELLDLLRPKLENLAGSGCVEDDEIWIDLRDWKPLAHHDELWRIYLRPSKAVPMAKKLQDLAGAELMILCGGMQILVAADEKQILPLLEAGQFAFCEKGASLKKRLPARDALQEKLMRDLKAVFDPDKKFGDLDAH